MIDTKPCCTLSPSFRPLVPAFNAFLFLSIVNTGVSSFVDQVTRFEDAAAISWQTEKSLFMVFFGISVSSSRFDVRFYRSPHSSPPDDIGYSYLHGQWFPHLIDQILLAYEKQILRLYADGGAPASSLFPRRPSC